MIFEIFFDFLAASVAGFGFAYATNPPFKTLIFTALIAGTGHALRFFLINIFGETSLAVATFFASFCVGCLALILAKILRTTAEIIAFPALLVMIPGIYAYRAILRLIAFINSAEINEKTLFLTQFFDALFTTISVTFAIGVGVSVTLLIFFEQSLMTMKSFKKEKNGN